MRSKNFKAIQQLQPDARLKQLFQQNWPAYKRWFLVDGDAARPSYLHSRRKLEEYMPEIVPLYDRLLDLFDCGDTAARFLSLYRPPPFASGCSQAIWTREPLALLRNYDFPPRLFDGVMIHSSWTGTGVIAMSDCIWGVLDGINEHGLALSLAFGGRLAKGDGFGITLVLRYILEVCANTREAIEVFKSIPVHMDYNIAVLDRSGDYATVMVAPDREVSVEPMLVSANRQDRDGPPLIKGLQDTVIRESFLEQRLQDPHEFLQNMAQHFVRSPLYRFHDMHESGTLYTAAYYPQLGSVDFIWPDAAWHQSFHSFSELERTIEYN